MSASFITLICVLSVNCGWFSLSFPLLFAGLNTSPHLVSLTERFRLNGVPIADDLFLHHFWAVWDGLVRTAGEAARTVDGQDAGPPVPSHFRFLTLVAYHLFLTNSSAVGVPECVILEVGLGGKLDATNIVAAPVVVGFSSIGYDHMEVLGYTLGEIAREKAGIIKRHVAVCSTANQAREVKEVLEAAALAEDAPIRFVKPLEPASSAGQLKLGLAGAHQLENAGLACALAHEFLVAQARLHPSDERFADYRASASGVVAPLDLDDLPPKFLRALAATRWPGRCQRLTSPTHPQTNFFIDGAHTDASMRVACSWFKQVDAQERAQAASAAPHNQNQNDCAYALLFNCGHVRDPIELMIPLVGLQYPSINVGAASSASSTSPSSSSSASAAASSSSTSAAAAAAALPISFSHVVCSPFDHDRPHFSSAPSFERLLRNYLLPVQRCSNFALAKGVGPPMAPTTSPSVHPVILQFIQDRCEFPAGQTAAAQLQDPQAAAKAQQCIDRILAHVLPVAPATFPPSAAPTTPATSWQHTLFRVWSFLDQAFQHAVATAAAANSENGAAVAAPAAAAASSQCVYASSVRHALQGIHQLAEQDPQHRPLKVLVTGSLYIVGNVLEGLGYDEAVV